MRARADVEADQDRSSRAPRLAVKKGARHHGHIHARADGVSLTRYSPSFAPEG
jgi:hypothetical protein